MDNHFQDYPEFDGGRLLLEGQVKPFFRHLEPQGMSEWSYTYILFILIKTHVGQKNHGI